MVKDLCFVVIEKCLNNCKFCSSNSSPTKTHVIAIEDFKRTIDYFMAHGGIEELSLSGGEPFLHPNLIEMVTYAKQQGIRTVIFTSGVVEDSKISPEDKEIILAEEKQLLSEIEQHEPDNEFLKNQVTKYYANLLKRKNIVQLIEACYVN